MENINENVSLKWDDCYLLGNEKVDNQHKELFNLVNSLVRSCDSGEGTDKLKETLLFMINYTVLHFDDEEALQIECKYPDYEKHKKMHDDFKVVVLGLVDRFSNTGSSAELSSDVRKIIVKWLVNHIMTEDKKIGDFLRGHRRL